ncbi:hypothetical protein RFI_29247 [Reticulomyxa filosa]|uniref:RGS domain-containing protein n=1 Tax=Reticulomyxa filosa TaxID=46433 RepID=X6M3B9_RETFI|nr:hypothetical protein RFI_29247 [Reticulomyxa filosa]|eukprot:ETO08141.1 hypothetical protein RFI_29247 [Reticulomyxa filosa]
MVITRVNKKNVYFIGREYFDRYLEQSFCLEYMHFLRDFIVFKGLKSQQERFDKASQIFLNHFSLSAAEYIDVQDNSIHIEKVFYLKKKKKKYIYYKYFACIISVLINCAQKKKKKKKLRETLLQYAQSTSQMKDPSESLAFELDNTLLDNVYVDVKQCIEKDIWPQFVNAIQSVMEATRPHVI